MQSTTTQLEVIYLRTTLLKLEADRWRRVLARCSLRVASKPNLPRRDSAQEGLLPSLTAVAREGEPHEAVRFVWKTAIIVAEGYALVLDRDLKQGAAAMKTPAASLELLF
jgi:hypothetical protein